MDGYEFLDGENFNIEHLESGENQDWIELCQLDYCNKMDYMIDDCDA